jgi:hypothetical protein
MLECRRSWAIPRGIFKDAPCGTIVAHNATIFRVLTSILLL